MTNILEIKQLHQSFNVGTANERHILKGINLNLKQGEFVSVIGGNGAGKSTLMNSIAGSLPITQGQILLAGRDVTYEPVAKRARAIGRVFQDPQLGTAPLLTVEENLSLAMLRGQHHNCWSFGVKRKQRQFLQAQLASLNLGLENRLQSEIGLLSGGQRQALTLLMATLQRPDLLLLDEHTAALDPQISLSVMKLTDKLVHEQQLTTLMITHNMADALAYSNRLIMLDQGQIVVDVSGVEKQTLTVPDLLALFKERQGMALVDDRLLMS